VSHPSTHASGAYLAPNNPSGTFSRVSANELQQRTGIDFLPHAPTSSKSQVMPLPPPSQMRRGGTSRATVTGSMQHGHHTENEEKAEQLLRAVTHVLRHLN
jgi:hypothetical protein